MFSLQGKSVVITGAASGIGRASALQFAAAGAVVTVADRDVKGAERTVALVQADGGRAVAASVDVTDPAALAAMIATAEATFDRVDVVFANAGYTSLPSSSLELSEEDFDRTVGVNLKGVWLTARAAVPALRRSGGGSILVTTSVMAIKARPQFSAYGPTKAAAGHLVRTFALEFAADNIRVNAIAPAVRETPMLARFIGSETAEAKAAFIEGIPLGRSVSADDVAHAAIYLASDEASFVSGVTLSIDGGRAASCADASVGAAGRGQTYRRVIRDRVDFRGAEPVDSPPIHAFRVAALQTSRAEPDRPHALDHPHGRRERSSQERPSDVRRWTLARTRAVGFGSSRCAASSPKSP